MNGINPNIGKYRTGWKEGEDMVILIGGDSHTGKTYLAQRLLERFQIPYTSIDHIKMGLIRGGIPCGFTAVDNDDVITKKLWGVIKGIIDTCLENKQNIILEGCYLPPDRVACYLEQPVVPVYLGFSSEYINNHFDRIIGMEHIIEHRKFPEERGIYEFIQGSRRIKTACERAGVRYFEIQSDYTKELESALSYIEGKIRAQKTE